MLSPHNQGISPAATSAPPPLQSTHTPPSTQPLADVAQHCPDCQQLNQKLKELNETVRVFKKNQLLLYALNEAQNRINQLQNERDNHVATQEKMREESHHWWKVADHLNCQLNTIYASRSWRHAKPFQLLRYSTSNIYHALRNLSFKLLTTSRTLLKYVIRQLARPFLKFTIHIIKKNPALKTKAFAFTKRYPHLAARLMQIYLQPKHFLHNTQNKKATASTADSHDIILSREAAQLYQTLRLNIKRRNNGQ